MSGRVHLVAIESMKIHPPRHLDREQSEPAVRPAPGRGTAQGKRRPDMAALEIHQFICIKDNYGVLLRDPATGMVASIDAPNADEVAAALSAKGWKLTHILTTHRHGDHTDGNLALKAATGCTIIGPRGEAR
jgi:hypothetical protein